MHYPPSTSKQSATASHQGNPNTSQQGTRARNPGLGSPSLQPAEDFSRLPRKWRDKFERLQQARIREAEERAALAEGPQPAEDSSRLPLVWRLAFDRRKQDLIREAQERAALAESAQPVGEFDHLPRKWRDKSERQQQERIREAEERAALAESPQPAKDSSHLPPSWRLTFEADQRHIDEARESAALAETMQRAKTSVIAHKRPPPSSGSPTKGVQKRKRGKAPTPRPAYYDLLGPQTRSRTKGREKTDVRTETTVTGPTESAPMDIAGQRDADMAIDNSRDDEDSEDI